MPPLCSDEDAERGGLLRKVAKIQPLAALYLHLGLPYSKALDQIFKEIGKQKKELSKVAKLKYGRPVAWIGYIFPRWRG